MSLMSLNRNDNTTICVFESVIDLTSEHEIQIAHVSLMKLYIFIQLRDMPIDCILHLLCLE